MSPWHRLAVFRLRRVKWKIMLPFLVLTGLFAMFATMNITKLVTSSLEERLDAQLVSASQHAADAIAKRERSHLELVRTVAFTQGVADAVEAGDRRALEGLILPAAANAAAEDVEVFNVSGASVYGVWNARDPATRETAPFRTVPADWTAVREVLAGASDGRGDKFAQVVATSRGTMLMSVGPVRNEQGRLIGAVAVASRLENVLIETKRNAFADVTIFTLQGAALASTFDIADASPENGFLRGSTGEWQPGRGSDGEVLGRPFHFIESYLVVRGEPLGGLTVALPVDSVSATGDATRLRMSIIFGVIALAVIVIGWLIARHLTSRLIRLVNAAALVSRGDLSARSNIRPGDEIGMLGVSFDAMAEQLEQQHIATIGALASAIDARDPYTAGHSVRVGELSFELGSNMGMPGPTLHHLRIGGLLHDIGKIGVRDTILLKAGPLTADERRIIEQHPTIGLRILESARLPREVLEIVGSHHERLDGSGYPLGVSKEELTMFPRITMVADMYDAITTDRPYRSGLSPQEALKILWEDVESGRLDPEVVATMRRIAQVWEERRAGETAVSGAWLENLHLPRGAREAA